MRKVKSLMKYLLAVLLVITGSLHFINADFFVSIMPPYIPWHLELCYLSGVIEIALGLTILLPKYRAIAAWGIIALLIAVFPANIHMAINSQLFPQYNPSALWLRLPLQGVFIAWAYWYTRPETS